MQIIVIIIHYQNILDCSKHDHLSQSILQKDTTDKSNTGQVPENYTCIPTELESVAEMEECWDRD